MARAKEREVRRKKEHIRLEQERIKRKGGFQMKQKCLTDAIC